MRVYRTTMLHSADVFAIVFEGDQYIVIIQGRQGMLVGVADPRDFAPQGRYYAA